ncbi:MAG: DUF1858 domain-containing protein [Calditrichaceae bacterium]
MRITKDMTIEEIVEKYPETISPMQKLGVKCIVCGEPVWGTLEENVIEKGLNLEEIISKLNEVTEELVPEK